MASTHHNGIKTWTPIIVLAFALCLHSAQGNNINIISCENLNKDSCAFAVSSSGKRCVLEKKIRRSDGEEAYACRTSDIEADRLKDWIESDECIQSCGLDRHSLGISSDSLLESSFTHKLCSPSCYSTCPNILDLYFNLAAAEGVYLPKLCEVQGANARRGMTEIKSSGMVAPGPESAAQGVEALSLSMPPSMPPM
ncbi:hypothetical protein M9H77_29961 [Catharanthus roseus]|uniref:Uncharacterized protein n=1 Tax=Catharanthus roseus TaxID=4058 RepID=A0ACB9ZWQ0_CATRO|nr:hypothetical protein M9H77_29961 [Catharanthus roseus]